MRSNRLFDFPDWTVVSYGNGLAYTLTRKDDDRSILFQGDDADRFMIELTALTEGAPALSWPDALTAIWNDYAS